MTDPLIKVKDLHKRYGHDVVLDNLSFTINRGEIIGLFGPNGASKTTLMRALMGLTPAQGEISIFGKPLAHQGAKLMEKISFIADTGILPRWMRVGDCLDYVEAVHPNFNRKLALDYITKTEIKPNKRISQLSKGMVTQLHLALVMAINSSLMLLDEPTLGLDIVYRKNFYTDLLEQYFDHEKTIIVTTHQFEEIEDIVTRVIFINNGKLLLDEKISNLDQRFCEVRVERGMEELALAHNPLYSTRGLEGTTAWFETDEPAKLLELGPCSRPKISNLFIAKVMQARTGGSADAH